MTTYKPPVMVQTDAPDPDFTLTFAGNGFQDNAWITVDDLFCVNYLPLKGEACGSPKRRLQ